MFKNGPSKICGRQPLKKLKGYACFKQTIPLQIFFHKILLGPFLNTLSLMSQGESWQRPAVSEAIQNSHEHNCCRALYLRCLWGYLMRLSVFLKRLLHLLYCYVLPKYLFDKLYLLLALSTGSCIVMENSQTKKPFFMIMFERVKSTLMQIWKSPYMFGFI